MKYNNFVLSTSLGWLQLVNKLKGEFCSYRIICCVCNMCNGNHAVLSSLTLATSDIILRLHQLAWSTQRSSPWPAIASILVRLFTNAICRICCNTLRYQLVAAMSFASHVVHLIVLLHLLCSTVFAAELLLQLLPTILHFDAVFTIRRVTIFS